MYKHTNGCRKLVNKSAKILLKVIYVQYLKNKDLKWLLRKQFQQVK